MLAFIEKFFKVYATPMALDKLRGDKTTTKAWMDFGDKIDLRHIGKKMAYVLRANKTLLDEHDGDVPNNRETLQKMNGVGRHVASIAMAWCHQEAEFGIDVHVKRILQRWGYITEEMKDIEVEEKVKELIPSKEIGHFSRSFVDHGQTVCGYTPDCQNCYLKHSCPTAAKHLEW
jgi:endonuclease-3